MVEGPSCPTLRSSLLCVSSPPLSLHSSLAFMGNTIGFGVGLGLGLGAAVGAATLLTQAADPNDGHLQRSMRSGGVLENGVVASQSQRSTEDIDESSAEGLRDAESYARGKPMLIEVPVLGTSKQFWRLSDEATRISRKLALILWRHHSVGKCLAAPLQVSNVWIGSTGSVKLRGVSFTGRGFSTERVRDDYRHLSRVLMALIAISGGDVANSPPDYRRFLQLLARGNFEMKDEFLIVNSAALLPMKNRTEVFLMLYNIILRVNQAKRRRILSNLPYRNSWLDTARANTKINRWGDSVPNEYNRTTLDLLRLNRNVRSHLHEYGDDDMEELLYCEWPMLLMVMEERLYLEGELQGTDIQNKFG